MSMQFFCLPLGPRSRFPPGKPPKMTSSFVSDRKPETLRENGRGPAMPGRSGALRTKAFRVGETSHGEQESSRAEHDVVREGDQAVPGGRGREGGENPLPPVHEGPRPSLRIRKTAVPLDHPGQEGDLPVGELPAVQDLTRPPPVAVPRLPQRVDERQRDLSFSQVLEIGRASCRGRVEISGVAVSLKNKMGYTRCRRDWSSDVCSSALALRRSPSPASRSAWMSGSVTFPSRRSWRSEERRVGEEWRFRGSPYH